MRLVADKLLDLPNGLQFEEFAVQWFIPDGVRSAVILVSRCSKTLRSLKITNYLEGTLLRPWFSSDNFSPLRVDPFKGDGTRPLKSDETQGPGIWVQKAER